jgi:hypothetical protein
MDKDQHKTSSNINDNKEYNNEIEAIDNQANHIDENAIATTTTTTTATATTAEAWIEPRPVVGEAVSRPPSVSVGAVARGGEVHLGAESQHSENVAARVVDEHPTTTTTTTASVAVTASVSPVVALVVSDAAQRGDLKVEAPVVYGTGRGWLLVSLFLSFSFRQLLFFLSFFFFFRR